jgi:hypothetical protein
MDVVNDCVVLFIEEETYDLAIFSFLFLDGLAFSKLL